MQRPWDLPGRHRQEWNLCVPGKSRAGEGWGREQWRACTDWACPSARKTSAAQPARSAKIPTALGLTVSQVSTGRAGGQG